MNLGGPVWHASTAAQRGLPIRSALENEALRQLAGVGDASRGEWREWSGKAFHIRRRLSVAEQRLVGDVMDIRRTPEAIRRAAALGGMLRFAPPEVLDDELGGIQS